MPDTVSASVIVASLGDTTPSFMADDGWVGPAISGAAHVAGAASTAEPASGLGVPLLVDFVTIGSIADPTPLPPTVSAHSALLQIEEFGPVVTGALHQS